MSRTVKTIIRLFLPVLIFLTGCLSQEPSDVEIHTDECTYCKMVISDGRFATQIVSDKGKSYPFDSIECMAAYEHQNATIAEGAKLYVSDFTDPGKWLLVEESDIYMSDDIQSPMGLSLFALSKESNVPGIIENAEQQTWQQTVEYVLTSWGNGP